MSVIENSDQCRYIHDGFDTDGTEWHLCTTHKELAPSDCAPCAGYVEAGRDRAFTVQLSLQDLRDGTGFRPGALFIETESAILYALVVEREDSSQVPVVLFTSNSAAVAAVRDEAVDTYAAYFGELFADDPLVNPATLDQDELLEWMAQHEQGHFQIHPVNINT